MSSVGVPKFGLKDCKLAEFGLKTARFRFIGSVFFFSSSSVRKFEARFESGLKGLELAIKV